jgi:type II secretory pathway pseudopilin PulG
MHSPTRREAFTLIELGIVVAVVIIMAAAGAPILGNMLTERRVAGEAVRLQQDLRLIQQYAITRRVLSSIVFDGSAQTYTYTLNGTTTVRSMTSIVQMDIGSGFSGTLSFDSFGSPLQGTSTPLSAAVQIGFQNATGSKRMVVSIQPVLGRVDTVWAAR